MLKKEEEKYFKKLNYLFTEGLKNGVITPFDGNFMKK